MEARLRALIAENGVFTRKDAVALGYHDHAIAMLVQSGVWVRVRRGAFVFGAEWSAMTENERYAVRCRAALRQARAEVVLSHLSSANEYGSPLWESDLSSVHLTREDGRAGRAEAGIMQHRGLVEDGDVLVRDGVRCMSGTRTALELTTLLDELGVFLEFDGKVKYESRRRDGESVLDCVLREKQRESMICEMTGWRCIRITWADLYRPAEVAQRIRKLLATPTA